MGINILRSDFSRLFINNILVENSFGRYDIYQTGQNMLWMIIAELNTQVI